MILSCKVPNEKRYLLKDLYHPSLTLDDNILSLFFSNTDHNFVKDYKIHLDLTKFISFGKEVFKSYFQNVEDLMKQFEEITQEPNIDLFMKVLDAIKDTKYYLNNFIPLPPQFDEQLKRIEKEISDN